MSETASEEFVVEHLFQKLNLFALTEGYARKLKLNVPNSIVEKCITYLKIPHLYHPLKDDVNFISDKDLKLCDNYKKIGNKYT